MITDRKLFYVTHASLQRSHSKLATAIRHADDVEYVKQWEKGYTGTGKAQTITLTIEDAKELLERLGNAISSPPLQIS